MIDIENAKKIFRNYVNKYDANDGRIALKTGHILRVAEISKNIAESLNLPEEDVKLAELIGLLHDIGRFEQITKYNTFNDKISINHGALGVKILFEDGLINEFNVDEKYYQIIKSSILNHNINKIEGDLEEKVLLHSKIIRDSDKLDIYHVLTTDILKNIYGCESMESETFSPEIIGEFYEEHYIDYTKRITFGDMWVSHIAYVFDFNFGGSFRIMKEKDYINKFYNRMDFKNKETIEQAEMLVKIANEYIKNRADLVK
ncbi:MAG: HD domain-containing protein [Clostridia bacterium]|nr:HD domain-containing protein [Clostridia bacterium]